MLDLLKAAIAVFGILFAIGGIAAVVALSRNYDSAMRTSDKAMAALAAVLVALAGYAVLF